MNTKPLALFLSATLILVVTGAKAEETNRELCTQECNRHWKGEWERCGEVKECKRFVEKKAKECLSICENIK